MCSSFSLLFVLIAACLGLAHGAQKCRVTDAQLLKAGRRVLFVGDRELFAPANDKEVDTHCKKIGENVETIKAYARCQKPFAKTLIALFAAGFKKENKKNCESKTWRKDFVETMQCLKTKGKVETIHKCVDRAVAALRYDVKNHPIKDQLTSACCVVLQETELLNSTATKHCGATSGDLISSLFKNNLGEVVQFVCASIPSMAKCRETFPAYAKEYERIFALKEVPKDNLIEPLLELALAQGS